jgi:hypothetical protein
MATTQFDLPETTLVLVKLGSEASTQEINGDNAVWSARNHVVVAAPVHGVLAHEPGKT